MKKISVVCREHSEYASLVRAVVRALHGTESIADINTHSIDGGFGEFCYYSDTVPFYFKHRASIVALAESLAEELGTGTVSMVRNFNCLVDTSTRGRTPGYSEREIAMALYGKKDDDLDVIYNALTWFAAEEVCRWFEED